MTESPVVVVHPDEADASPSTPGMEFRKFFDRDRRWIGFAGWIRNEAGDKSGWHHHADNQTFVYVIRGSVTFDFGASGAQRAVARAGDFVFVPAHTRHHEMTSEDEDLEAFVFRVGGRPST